MLQRVAWYKLAAVALIAAIATYCADRYTGDMEIIPIESSMKIFTSGDQRQIHQKFIVVRAPSDPYALKQALERYDQKHPLEDDNVSASRESGPRQKAGRRTWYLREFYRQSRDTPRDWNGEPDVDKDARAAAHMQDRIARILWEEGSHSKDYFCYDLDRDDCFDDPGVFFYQDGTVKDSRNEPKPSKWILEIREDGQRIPRKVR